MAGSEASINEGVVMLTRGLSVSPDSTQRDPPCAGFDRAGMALEGPANRYKPPERMGLRSHSSRRLVSEFPRPYG